MRITRHFASAATLQEIQVGAFISTDHMFYLQAYITAGGSGWWGNPGRFPFCQLLVAYV
jgi:hypothetical protein